MFTEDDFYGAKIEEVLGLINYVTRHEDTYWTAHGDHRTGEALIAGIRLRVRHSLTDKGLSRLTITGNGWMIGFNVTIRRPRNLPSEQSWMTARVELHDRRGAAMLCLHGLTILSPEEFRNEMALLRMFSSEWA